MKFKAEIEIMPLEALLDPQGKAVKKGLHTIGLTAISNVRVGKHIQLVLEAASKEEAEEKVKEACKKLLVNQIMEQFTFSIEEVQMA